jgi:hypothetical protein
MGNGRLTIGDVARLLDVKPSTVRAYKTRGQMPAPDGRLGRTPWWRTETITAWRSLRG